MPGRISLTMGPILFNWPTGKWCDFYKRLADEAPIDTVCLGEVVCSKRLPSIADEIVETADRLRRGGKAVVLSTLALITSLREKGDCRNIVRNEEFEFEINDLTALTYVDPGQRFRVGPLVNVYNESTLQFLAHSGASVICLPPELPISAVEKLGHAAQEAEIGCELWSFGRIPLAISARCYHARIAGATRDSCRFVCENDSDGLDVKTLNAAGFLAINGTQTLSHSYCNLIGDIHRIESAGITSLRLSPHSCDMVAIATIFRKRLDGIIAPEEARAKVKSVDPSMVFSNGFLFGGSGAELVDTTVR